MTNADKENEVQEHVVTAKKGKKRGIKAITSLLVNNASVVSQNSDSFCFTTRVGGNMNGGISRGEYYPRDIPLILREIYIDCFAIASAPLSPVTIKAATSILDRRQ